MFDELFCCVYKGTDFIKVCVSLKTEEGDGSLTVDKKTLMNEVESGSFGGVLVPSPWSTPPRRVLGSSRASTVKDKRSTTKADRVHPERPGP